MIALLISINSEVVDFGAKTIYQTIEKDGFISRQEYDKIIENVSLGISGATYKELKGPELLEIKRFLNNIYQKSIISRYQSNLIEDN